MKRIAIGGRQEYIRRLTDYLIRQLPADIRIYSFTKVKHLLNHKEKVDFYVLEEEFHEELRLHDYALKDNEFILITDRLSDQSYCRFENPGKLLHMLQSMIYQGDKRGEKSGTESCLIGLYAPSADISLKNHVWQRMKAGSLYLGFQDMGGPDEDSEMAELSYYIHLREDSILSELRRLAHPCEGRFFLDSPAWFFDYLGLNEEDYIWFFQTLKSQSDYSDIYVGFNNAVVPSLSFFQKFDRLLLVNPSSSGRVSSFCERLERTLAEEGVMKRENIMRWEEFYSDSEPYGPD